MAYSSPGRRCVWLQLQQRCCDSFACRHVPAQDTKACACAVLFVSWWLVSVVLMRSSVHAQLDLKPQASLRRQGQCSLLCLL